MSVETLASDVPQGASFDAWRVPLLSREQFMTLGRGGSAPAGEPRWSNEQLRYLASFGLLAPSSHNSVPQRFRLAAAGGRIDVAIDRRAVLPASDPSGRQGLVSVGCCLTNLELAGAALGVGVRARVLPEAANALPLGAAEPAAASLVDVLSLELVRLGSPGLDGEWLSLLREHKVVRAEYDRRIPLPVALARRLGQVARDASPSVELHLLDDPSRLRALGRFQEQADRFVFEMGPFTRELGDWLLPNDVEAGVGMRGREFGFDDRFAEHVHQALRAQSLLPDQLAGFAKGGRMGVESSSAVAVISVEQETPAAWIDAGRAAHRVSLECQREGFCSAYHASLTEVEWARQMLAASVLHTTRTPAVLLRIGKPKRPDDLARPHASRPPLNDVLFD
ncbi:MAG TPA: hypothetical protein VMG12_07985 [Polyangiaceae bacterium]|nr:hypothetical protein [Polyangiaceae bacterium]